MLLSSSGSYRTNEASGQLTDNQPKMILRALFIIALVTAFQDTVSHDWLTFPRTYNRVFRTRDCKGAQCREACPPRWARGMNNSVEEPAAVWRRGETVRITYARNNHHGGMIRIALVPVNKMWGRGWHEKMTLMHGCWESGRYNCDSKKEDCGTDKNGDAFSRKVVIPSVFPNGNYVLGFVWYGGLFYNSRRGFFADFYSCSHVKISGGIPLGGSFQPYFEAGVGPKIKRGKCRTSADAIGQCEKTGCPKKKSFRSIASVFKGRNQPDPITPEIVARGFKTSGSADTDNRGNPSYAGGMPKPAPTNEEYEEDSAYGVEGDDGTRTVDKGICSGRVCCASICKQCGGTGCQNRKGAAPNCCIGSILQGKRRCSRKVGAPCIRG